MQSHNLGLGVVSAYQQVHHRTKIFYKLKPGHALLHREKNEHYGCKEILRKNSTNWPIGMFYFNKTKTDIIKAKKNKRK